MTLVMISTTYRTLPSTIDKYFPCLSYFAKYAWQCKSDKKNKADNMKSLLAIRQSNVIGNQEIAIQMLLVVANCNSVGNQQIESYCYLPPQSEILRVQ